MAENIPVEGYLYICVGQKYVQEAISSATSLRKVDPAAHITLITDEKISSDLFDLIETAPYQGSNYLEALLYRVEQIYNSPYQKTFFLDSDTHFFSSCRELFELLDFYDVCLAPAPVETTPVLFKGKALKGYQPYNMGVVVFNKNQKNQKLFSSWLEIYRTKVSEQNDQPAFMQALLRSESRICTLSSVYNARLDFVQFFPPYKVKLMHSRYGDPTALEKVINEREVGRAWVPGIDRVLFRREKGLKGAARAAFWRLPMKLQFSVKKIKRLALG